MLCCQQFTHCHSAVSALKQCLTLEMLRETQTMSKKTRNWASLSVCFCLTGYGWAAGHWWQCPSGHPDHETIRFPPCPRTLCEAVTTVCSGEKSLISSATLEQRLHQNPLPNRLACTMRKAHGFIQIHKYTIEIICLKFKFPLFLCRATHKA